MGIRGGLWDYPHTKTDARMSLRLRCMDGTYTRILLERAYEPTESRLGRMDPQTRAANVRPTKKRRTDREHDSSDSGLYLSTDDESADHLTQFTPFVPRVGKKFVPRRRDRP